MTRQVVFTHPLMGTEGDQHRHLLRPALESRVRSSHEEGQRTAPGAIRYHQAHRLSSRSARASARVTKAVTSSLESSWSTPPTVSARGGVTRIRAVVRRRSCRCRGGHVSVLVTSSAVVISARCTHNILGQECRLHDWTLHVRAGLWNFVDPYYDLGNHAGRRQQEGLFYSGWNP